MNGLFNFYLFIAAFSISQIVLALAKILSNKQPNSSEILFCSFLFCVGVYLSEPLIITNLENPYWMRLLWRHLPTAIPALFLLCSASIFLDNYKFKAVHLFGIVLILFPPFAFDTLALPNQWEIPLVEIPQLIEYVYMLAALWLIARSWKADLIEQRRQLRFWVMGISGAIILSVIFAQQLSGISEVEIDLIHFPIAALLLLLINIFLLTTNPTTQLLRNEVNESEQLQANEAPAKHQGLSPVQEELLIKLNTMMNNEKYYRNPKLTITELAWQLKIPEYKLRELINQGLGFRNFNEYLNHYRIEEACKLLSQGKQNITTIANEVGFNTLSAFNRTFKDKHNCTPSGYRKQKIEAFE